VFIIAKLTGNPLAAAWARRLCLNPAQIEMLTLAGEHSDTICLNLQAPGFAGVMCSGESDSTERNRQNLVVIG
jgi:hypothetical protein